MDGQGSTYRFHEEGSFWSIRSRKFMKDSNHKPEEQSNSIKCHSKVSATVHGAISSECNCNGVWFCTGYIIKGDSTDRII